MTELAETREVVIQGSAADLAFRAGQLLEGLLIDRAAELAKDRSDGALVVTVENIRASLDDPLVEQLHRALGVPIDGQPTARRRLSA